MEIYDGFMMINPIQLLESVDIFLSSPGECTPMCKPARGFVFFLVFSVSLVQKGWERKIQILRLIFEQAMDPEFDPDPGGGVG